MVGFKIDSGQCKNPFKSNGMLNDQQKKRNKTKMQKKEKKTMHNVHELEEFFDIHKKHECHHTDTNLKTKLHIFQHRNFIEIKTQENLSKQKKY